MTLRRIEARKQKRQRMFMGIFITVIMVMSGFGVYLSGRGAERQVDELTGLRYNIDYDVQMYQLTLNKENYDAYFLPSQVYNIPVSDLAIQLIQSSPVMVMTFNPHLNQENLQILDFNRYSLTQTITEISFINAMTTNSSVYSLPELTCDNATQTLPIISFEEAENPSIERGTNPYCVAIKGNETSFLQAKDRLVYEYYNVYDEVRKNS